MEKTIFSKIIDKTISADIIYEDEKLIVIKDISPQAPIHFLLIPKTPIINIKTMTDGDDHEYGTHIFKVARYLSQSILHADSFKLIINNGYEAGQRVFHLHAHFLAGYKNEEIM